jgi:hypothetical protein
MNYDWEHGAKGLLYGGLMGGMMGLGVCMYLIEGTWLFPGDTIAIGALVCGILGFLFGEVFIDWLKANWWRM